MSEPVLERFEFDVGDEFRTLDTYRWTVTNRMLDVDTDEVLYYLRGKDPDADNHGETKVISQAELLREAGGWTRLEGGSE